MSRFELSLERDYVPDWTLTDAVRELFQNALDQQTVNPANEMFFEYEQSGLGGYFMGDVQLPIPGKLKIGNKTSVLETNSLLLGSSSKRNDPNTIGKFGEGYKIAALVLTRLGKKLTIYNYGARELWEFKFTQPKKYQYIDPVTKLVVNPEILTVDVKKNFFWQKAPDNNLTMVVENITDEDYKLIELSNLKLQEVNDAVVTKYGNILLEEKFKGLLFVSGLFITRTEFEYGYDIKPAYITLDRDRKTVADFHIAYITCRLWMESGLDDIMKQLIKANAKDVQHVVYHVPANSSASYVLSTANEFKKEHGTKAVAVTTQAEATQAKRDGKKPVIVSATEQHLINSAAETPVIRGGKIVKPLTMYDRFNRWFKRNKILMPKWEQAHFKELLGELKERANK